MKTHIRGEDARKGMKTVKEEGILASIRSLPAFVVDFVMGANSVASFSRPIFCLEDLSGEISTILTDGEGGFVLITVAS